MLGAYRVYRGLALTKRATMGWAVSALLLIPALAQSQETAVYEIGPSPQGRFALEVFKTGIWNGKKHLFLFANYHGTVRYDRAAPENSRVELTVEGASAACQDTWISPSDLQKVQAKALEMMDVVKHPQISFTSQRIVLLGGDRFRVEGLLNIRGIPKPVSVDVRLAGQDGGALTFKGSAEVQLLDYGLKPPGAALVMIGTKNEMSLEFALPARRAK
jgi:polyisoprenoid-binding protein YceI